MGDETDVSRQVVERGSAVRGAARWATVVAVPLALVAGLGAYVLLGGSDGEPDGAAGTASPAPSSAGPTATGVVDVPAPTLSGRPAVVCRALLSRLPDALRDRDRRRVLAGPEQNAAYGDPPITVACGGPPATFPATDLVYVLDRVCWYAARNTSGTVWTTVDREVPVRVTVPAAYEEPGQWVIEFSGPLIATVPSGERRLPAGCNP